MITVTINHVTTHFMTTEADWITFREQCISLSKKCNKPIETVANILHANYNNQGVPCPVRYVNRIVGGIMEIKYND